MTDRPSPTSELDTGSLVDAGFTLHAVFDLDKLPMAIRSELGDLTQTQDYSQLLLFAHAGNTLWSAMHRQSVTDSDSRHPVDDYSRQQITAFLEQQRPVLNYRLIYPAASSDTACSTDHCPDLQSLGRLAGWHHDSPLKLGIHATYGSWFAYRAVVLCNGHFATTEYRPTVSACQSCVVKPCVSHCPAQAVRTAGFDLNACVDYRQSSTSRCKTQCLARNACPIGQSYRYRTEQMNYYYASSMQTIEARIN